MIKQLTDYVKQEGREFFVMTAVTFVLSIISFGYIYWIGTHLTASRNNFNHAQLAYDAGDYTTSKLYLQKSLDEWKNEEAQKLLDQVNDKSPDL
jgi:hypothetical protein